MMLRLPSAALESLLHDRAIHAHQLSAPPIFIIGHARSGTTHLHNLLALDPRFAFISYLQTSMPRQFMSVNRLEKALLRAALPANRGMDNVRMTLESAQEEEMALGILGDICSYKCFYFPDRLIHHFRESVLLEDVPAEKLQRFKDTYRQLVKKISYAAGGDKQILFKNPTNTCRIPLLLELFPDARFIHIVRNPHEVFHSMQKLWQTLVPGLSWHDDPGHDYQDHTLQSYKVVMQRYLDDRKGIPAGQLIEVRYENLDRDPVGAIRSIYDALALPEIDRACERVTSYCSSLRGYQKNKHHQNEDLRARVAEQWRFAFDAFGYPI